MNLTERAEIRKETFYKLTNSASAPAVDSSWSSTALVPTQSQRYLWKFERIYFSDGSVETVGPVNLSVAGADIDPKELEAFKKDLANTKTNVSELETTTDGIIANVSKLDDATVKKATLNFDSNGLVVQAGKVVDGKTFATMISQDPENVKVIANKLEVTADMIVNGAITADKIQAGSITADMFKAAKITSLNGATTFDLDSGNITFKKNLATINQVNGNYKSEVSLSSIKASIPAGDWSSVSTIAMDSTSFNTSKRRAGMRVDMMPTYSATLITGETISFAGETESLGTVANSISVLTKASEVDVINKDTKGPSGQWNYPMIMDFGINAAIRVPDIKLGGYTKSLKGILNDLCRKTGILWT